MRRALTLFFVFCLFAHASNADDKLAFFDILKKVEKHMSANYQPSDDFFVDYKEYICHKDATGFLAGIHIQSLKGGYNRPKGNLRFSLRVVADSLIKGEYYGNISGYGYTAPTMQRYGGNAYLNLNADIRFNLVTDENKKKKEPACCSGGLVEVRELYNKYRVHDSISGKNAFWVLVNESKEQCYFDANEFLGKIPMPIKTVNEAKTLVGDWDNGIIYSRIVYIINKSDYAVIYRGIEKRYINTANKEFTLRYKQYYKKTADYYYEEFFEALLPRFDGTERCGFNTDNSYTRVLKRQEPVKNFGTFKQKHGLTRLEKIPQYYYNEFCTQLNKPSKSMKDSWDELKTGSYKK